MLITDNLTSEELAILSNIIALDLCKDKSINEINVLGNVIETIGCIMLTVAAQRQQLQALNQTVNTQDAGKSGG